MIKNVTREQFVAGALLLNFNIVSNVDISLLMDDFGRKNLDWKLIPKDFEYISNYIQIEGNDISLKPGLTLESYILENDSTLKKILEQIAGNHIRAYLKNFDMEEFVLRKIKYHIELSESDIDRLYCKVQKDELNSLEDKGYLTRYWEDDCIHEDYRITKLSNCGNLRLFKIDYAKELERFTLELNSLRYDPSILEDFLMKQDLSLPVWNVLDLEKFEAFCNDYDRAVLLPGSSRLHFERLKSKDENIFDELGKKLMQDMLGVWDDGHCIYICHPNHIFAGAALLTRDIKEIKNVNWDDINVQKMFEINDYKIFISPNCSEAFKYVHKRLGNHIMEEIRKGNEDNAVSYLVVVEKYQFDYDDYYLIRGIIRGDALGYGLAFNPEYQKVIPQGIFEKSLRFSGQEIPDVYCLKRKK